MKLALQSTLGAWLAIWAAAALAVVGEAAPLAPEPTVSTGWVVFFMFVFVGVCVWIGYAIWRADKKR